MVDTAESAAFSQELFALLLKHSITIEELCVAVVMIMAEKAKGGDKIGD